VTFQRELLVNQIAQGVCPAREGEEWFSALPENEQQEVLRGIANMAVQAGARRDDAEDAVRRSGLKPTVTPCVLLTKENLPVQLAKIVNLPAGEYRKAYTLLMALFQIADARRRVIQCAGGCSHWWHRDLSNGRVVEELLSSGAA
jgi:hypothetical protein